jgi:hypothetical protein
MNKVSKISEMTTIGTAGANINKYINLFSKVPSPVDETSTLEGHASAIKLKNAKAAPHSVVASGREHKDDDDDDADGDDADGSGAN